MVRLPKTRDEPPLPRNATCRYEGFRVATDERAVDKSTRRNTRQKRAGNPAPQPPRLQQFHILPILQTHPSLPKLRRNPDLPQNAAGTTTSRQIPTITGRHMHSGCAICHYCGSQTLVPEKCPLCRKGMTMIGLGSQRLEEDLAKNSPRQNRPRR